MNNLENNVSVSTDEIKQEELAKSLAAANDGYLGKETNGYLNIEATYDSSTATLLGSGANWTNETYEYSNEVSNGDIGKENANHDYAMNNGRNQEFYKDPTYHKMVINYENGSKLQRRDGKPVDIHRINGDRKAYRKSNSDYTGTPVYVSRKSKRYETIGLIMRICDIAGFELAERVVLKDKITGEILK